MKIRSSHPKTDDMYEMTSTSWSKSQNSPKLEWYVPRNWTRSCLGWASAVFIVIIVVIIAIVVTVAEANRYPDYSRLDYKLVDVYQGTSFFDKFDYFTAISLSLTSASATSAILRVDTSDTDSSTGRRSVRIESKSQYDDGLFIFDIIHTPYQCSVWPALWLTNRWNWPKDGEIDVVEAANTALFGNQATLHTANGCSMKGVKRYQSGRSQNENCFNGTRQNEGCGVRGASSTVGPEFNDKEGGVYAVELRSAGIRVWHFPRDNIPADIASLMNPGNTPGKVDPSNWPLPFADFPGTECPIQQYFRNQSLIANIDICGQWAGAQKYYSDESHCPGDCVQYVREQPGSVYEKAYWEFGGWWVLQAM